MSEQRRLNPRLAGNAVALRRAQTDAERALWQHLRSRRVDGFKFRRQHPLGPYIVDFVCLRAKLVVELDGSQHLDQANYDESRTRWLEQQGFRVVRFWNGDVLTRGGGVLEAIWSALAEVEHGGQDS